MKHYYQHIERTLERCDAEPWMTPRVIIAWMLLEHSTLDHLSERQFESEARAAIRAAREGGSELSADVADSFGL